MTAPPTAKSFTSLEQAISTFEQVLESSTADETELVWFQRRHRSLRHGADAPTGLMHLEGGAGKSKVDEGTEQSSGGESLFGDIPRLTVLIRVVEGGRVGWHRTDSEQAPFLQNGLRQALALAKVQEKVKSLPLLPTRIEETSPELPLFDPAIAELSHEDARRRLADWCGDDPGFLHWSETRVAVVNSHGIRRTAKTTEVSLNVRSGSTPNAGFAAASARSLDALNAPAVVARARELVTDTAATPLPEGRLPVVLAPEAVVELLNVLNTFAFSGQAYLEGTSFLSKHRDVQVFDRTVHVRDNALRIPGMPFPFDLEGSSKSPVDLIAKGQPSTPALNRAQSSEAGLRPTAHSVGGQDAMFGNLFLLAGAASQGDLLKAANGGLWIGWLDPPECREPQRMEIRGRARGVRRIVNGELGPPLPDLIWEASLLAALGRLLGIGNQSVVRAMPTTPLGGIAAPALALAEVDGFSPAPV